MKKLTFTIIASLALGGCLGTQGQDMSVEEPAALSTKIKYATPILSCPEVADDNTIALNVCAGATGAPAGFSVQWMTCDDYDAYEGPRDNNGWPVDETAFCKGSFSGNANKSNWNLGANACTDVVIGGLNDADPGVSYTCNEPLACESCYVFRAFAHATKTYNRSDFTASQECTTASCGDVGFNDGDFCTRSQGFYSSGVSGRNTMVSCFGGDPTGAACTSPTGDPLVGLGGGVYSYHWSTTGTCVDVQPGPSVFLLDGGINKLRTALGGGGSSGYFAANGSNATTMGSGGGLASQAAALTLNVDLSGDACTAVAYGPNGFPAGYGDAKLCRFAEGDTFKENGAPISAATASALNGVTVSQVLAAANAYLGGNGTVVLPYGLASAADLNELVANLNLAFDVTDWDGDGNDDAACGGMTSFAENHLCR